MKRATHRPVPEITREIGLAQAALANKANVTEVARTLRRLAAELDRIAEAQKTATP